MFDEYLILPNNPDSGFDTYKIHNFLSILFDFILINFVFN